MHGILTTWVPCLHHPRGKHVFAFIVMLRISSPTLHKLADNPVVQLFQYRFQLRNRTRRINFRHHRADRIRELEPSSRCRNICQIGNPISIGLYPA